jgi:uncharacterized protein (DUF2267 family)
MVNARFGVVRGAIEVVLRRLACMRPSDTTEQLHALLVECWQQVEQWSSSPPTDREGEILMKCVLELDDEVTKLERQALLAVVRGSGAPLN